MILKSLDWKSSADLVLLKLLYDVISATIMRYRYPFLLLLSIYRLLSNLRVFNEKAIHASLSSLHLEIFCAGPNLCEFFLISHYHHRGFGLIPRTNLNDSQHPPFAPGVIYPRSELGFE